MAASGFNPLEMNKSPAKYGLGSASANVRAISDVMPSIFF